MGTFEFDDPDQEYSAARRGLHDALENLDYLDYTLDIGPLTLADIARTPAASSDRMHEVVAEFGWPSGKEDGVLESTQRFSSNREFLESLRPVDEYGAQFVGMNRFFNLTSVAPIYEPVEVGRGIDLQGLNPVVHRAHALAPDLFDNLTITLNKLRERYSLIDNTDHLYEELVQSRNEDVVEAMHMAYLIMGRLIKVNDSSTVAARSRAHLRILRGNRHKDSDDYSEIQRPPILNADAYLRHGD